MRKLFALLKKDLTLEFRTKETLSVMLCLSVLLSVVLSSGVSSAFITSESIEKLFPMFIWFIFVVTAGVAVGRTYEYEVHNRAMEGVLLTGVSPVLVYLSKTASSALVIAVGHLVSVVALGVLLDVSVVSQAAPLALISALVILGYAGLATMIAAMTSTSKLKNLLLPLILLPLLFPLFFAAIELTIPLLRQGSLDLESFWFSLLLGLDLVYLVLGINLYEYLVHE